MRKYKLNDPLHPDGGPIINVKHDNDCVFCKHCTDVFWDYANLIYLIWCENNHDVSKRPCEYFEEGGEEKNEN